MRLYKISENPVSLSVDEVAFGYNAFSILKTGKDENGIFMPITFRSVGDYKNPVPAYTMVPFIWLLGLNEVSIRLPTVLFSIISIFVVYLLVKEMKLGTSIALISAFLVAISPWHIYFSRYVSDHMIAATLVLLGLFFFLKIKADRKIYAVLSAFFFSLSVYTYYSERLFVPLFVLALLLVERKKIKSLCKEYFLFLCSLVVFVFPIFYLSIFGPDAARASMVFITKDIEFTRGVLLNDVKEWSGRKSIIFDNILLFFYWARKYLNYFEPSFLFFSGLKLTRDNTLGVGILYLFEIVTLPYGLFKLYKKDQKVWMLLFFWIFIGIFPASLTNNEQHPLRTFVIFAPLLIFSAVGLYYLVDFIRRRREFILIKISSFTLLLVVLWSFIHFFITYSFVFPVQRGEDFMDGTKEAVMYALENKDKYDLIIFDPYRGVVSPYIVSIPHMYVLFYSFYDPKVYQTEKKVSRDEYYQFGKFVIKPINLPVDRNIKNSLLVGTPWSIPLDSVPPDKIVKKVYMKSGDLVFVLAETD